MLLRWPAPKRRHAHAQGVEQAEWEKKQKEATVVKVRIALSSRVGVSNRLPGRSLQI